MSIPRSLVWTQSGLVLGTWQTRSRVCVCECVCGDRAGASFVSETVALIQTIVQNGQLPSTQYHSLSGLWPAACCLVILSGTLQQTNRMAGKHTLENLCICNWVGNDLIKWRMEEQRSAATGQVCPEAARLCCLCFQELGNMNRILLIKVWNKFKDCR